MEILRKQHDGFLELFFEGRLDGYWAQHLATSIGEVMREGTHSVRLNLSKTSYISSAGIGTLVDMHKQFAAVNGSFGVVEPPRQVKHVLDMVGLGPMLYGGKPPEAHPAAAAPVAERREAGGAVFEIHDCTDSAEAAPSTSRCSPA